MTARTVSVLCVCLATILCVNVAADETASKDDATWVTVVQRPDAHADQSPYVVQITSGAKFKLVDAIVETLPKIGDDEIRLRPASKVNLTFHTDSFLVMKLHGESLTLAPGPTFPFSVTRKLVKSMSEISFSESLKCSWCVAPWRTHSPGLLHCVMRIHPTADLNQVFVSHRFVPCKCDRPQGAAEDAS